MKRENITKTHTCCVFRQQRFSNCVCVCGVAFEIETRPGEFSRTVVRSTPPRNKKKKIKKKRMKSKNKREITDLGRFGMNKIFPKLSLSRSTIVGENVLLGLWSVSVQHHH
jgi:hypothetical protein